MAEETQDQELERLREIARLELTDIEHDEILQGLVRRATEQFDLPIGLVSIVLDGAQHFIARVGLDGWLDEAGGTPREWAFCSFAVEQKSLFVVEDSHSNPLVQKNPLVTNDGVRCYAGAPLRTADGHVLGTLCVIGAEPREFPEAQLEALEGLARDVVGHLEARLAARAKG